MPRQPFTRLFRVPVHPGHHRLITEMSDIMVRDRWSPTMVCLQAGIGNGSISYWRAKGAMPRLASFDAVLNVMGYELCIRKKEAA